MNKACPKILLLNTFVEYEFQCYTDTESPKEAILWKINDVPTSKGIENRTIPIHLYGENVTKLGSSLRILPRIEDKNITCRYGNTSRVVFIHGQEIIFFVLLTYIMVHGLLFCNF